MGFMKNDIDLDEFVYKYNNHTILNLKLTKKDLIRNSLIALILVILIISIVFYISIKRKWIHTTQRLKDEIALKTRQLKEQNHLDGLTGSKNRKAYAENINEHLSLFKRYKNVFSLIIFDIDDFKNVNDTYGHKVGDKVLIELVKIVIKQTRKNDFLFRVGGEEFVIILSETQLESAKIVAENVRSSIEKELCSMNNNMVTISLGLSEVRESDTEDSLYTRTDMLLYESKKLGKNRVSY